MQFEYKTDTGAIRGILYAENHLQHSVGHHMMKKLTACILFASLFCITPTYAASFTCKVAKLKSEQQICRDLGLNDADVKLATTYQIVLHALPMGGRDAEKGKQFQWLKQRNACGASTPCIKRAYIQRQQQLDQLLQDRVLSHGPF